MNEAKPNRQSEKRLNARSRANFLQRKVAAKILPAPGGRVVVSGTTVRRVVYKNYLVELDDEPSLTITTDGKKR